LNQQVKLGHDKSQNMRKDLFFKTYFFLLATTFSSIDFPQLKNLPVEISFQETKCSKAENSTLVQASIFQATISQCG